MEFLESALNSITSQTYTNLEIITIDDGSSDGTFDYLTSRSKEDPRIRVIKNEENLKLIKTLNKAISLASGDYIARMDADDISTPDRIETLMKFQQETGADIVSCNFNYIDLEGKPLHTNVLRPTSENEILFSSFLFTPIGHAMLLGKKECFIKFPYDTNETSIHTEDYELWSRMIRGGVTFRNIDIPLYSIRINPDSVSFKFEDIQKENFFFNAHRHYEQYFNRTIDNETYKVVVNRFDSITSEKLREALKTINGIVKHFDKESDASSIRKIAAMQKFDILYAAFRKGSFELKFSAFWKLCFLLLGNFTSKKFNRYIRSKF